MGCMWVVVLVCALMAGPPPPAPLTAREQSERAREARALHGHTLLRIPDIGRVAWRYDSRERFVTVLDVPDGGASEDVWMTVGGRLVKIGQLDPGDRGEAGAVAQGPVDVRVVQKTEPATVTATIHVVYAGDRNAAASAPLVTARIATRDHGVP